MLPLARALTHDESRLNTNDAIKPCEDICEGHADLLRLTIGFAGQIHNATHALDQEIITRTFCIRPGVAETRDRAIDEARIDRLQAFVVEAVFIKSTELKVLNHHIRIGNELAYKLPALISAKIGNDRLLATIAGVEIGCRLFTFHVDKWRAPFAGIITLRAFNLDNIRAKVGQRLPDPWARQNAGQFNDFQTRKRCILHFSKPLRAINCDQKKA